MSLRTIVVTNYGAALVSAAAPLVALPFYVNDLGTANWGLVSFATTLAMTLGMLEIGVSQRLIRDLTVIGHSHTTTLRSLAKGIEVHYWLFALLLSGIVLMAAQPLVTQWLNTPSDKHAEGYWTVCFCAVLVLTQIPNAAYRSFLVASDHQVPLALQSIAFNLLKHGGGVAVVTRGYGLDGLYTYLGCLALIDTIARRLIVHLALRRGEALPIDWKKVRSLLIAGLKMSAAVIASIAALQLDRLLLSRFGSLSELGIYSIAASLAFGALQLSTPLVTSFAPRLAVAAAVAPSELDRVCKQLLKALLMMIIAAAAIYLAIGESLIALWLRNPDVFDKLKWPLRLLLVGTAMHTIYQIGYERWVAMGQTSRILRMNLLALTAASVLAPTLILSFGMVGAASVWLSFNMIGLAFHSSWLASLLRPLDMPAEHAHSRESSNNA